MRSILGMVKVQLTMGIPGMTSSTTQSPKSSARRCAHEGQRQFVLHENAKTSELPQDLQRIRAKPLRKSPQSVNVKNFSRISCLFLDFSFYFSLWPQCSFSVSSVVFLDFDTSLSSNVLSIYSRFLKNTIFRWCFSAHYYTWRRREA